MCVIVYSQSNEHVRIYKEHELFAKVGQGNNTKQYYRLKFLSIQCDSV